MNNQKLEQKQANEPHRANIAESTEKDVWSLMYFAWLYKETDKINSACNVMNVYSWDFATWKIQTISIMLSHDSHDWWLYLI